MTNQDLSIKETKTEATAIEVDIFNVRYTVKPPNNLTVDDIKELANYIDGLART